jgi:RNA polymerase sigma factor (sigma-70 family)
MPNGQLSAVVAYLRRVTTPRAEADATDAQLLERFVARRDEAAFAALLRRHGPLVWGVCRRLLPQTADAEDAFQATLLVFARRARSISKRASVRSWLYTVARRVALRALADARRRQGRERPLLETLAAGPAPDEAGWELRSVLDEEIERLPGHERLPVILCYLEGRTLAEAAQELGCPKGTVGARLARARHRLGRRLARRGVTLSGAPVAAVLGGRAAQAAVPPALLEATVRAATLIAAGRVAAAGVVSARVAALTEGVLRAMFMQKVKLGAAFLVLAALVVGGAAVFLRPAAAQTAPDNKLPEAHRAAEYKVVAFASDQQDPAAVEKEFAKKANQLAPDGWEYAWQVRHGNVDYVFFKRGRVGEDGAGQNPFRVK